MSDRIVVMRDGLIQQIGTPAEIYNYPSNAFVADFIGSANLVKGRIRSDLARDGFLAIETPGGQIMLIDAHGRPVTPEVTVSVRTAHFQVTTEKPSYDTNVWPVQVSRSVFLGDFVQLNVDWGGTIIVVRSLGSGIVPAGQPAWLHADPRHCVLLTE